MRYIVVCKDNTVFYTAWFEKENHWNDNIYCVIDWNTDTVTFDGDTWYEIDVDHL